jgi:hypothetical protein
MPVDPGYGFLAPQGNGRREGRTLLPLFQTSLSFALRKA